ncbi:MAG: TPM domain-containing protein [Rhodobacteraceae bacterium]|nr:TPM domain-containing protein [Paracoccaceae bacterium]
MTHPLARLVLCLIMLCGPAAAQTDRWPEAQSLYLNDYADLIPPQAEARLIDRLAALRAETGVEMTVLTIASRADYVAGETIEGFATTLFNIWGVGDATRNDGILILVAREDREMRIALGSGYDQAWDSVAQQVIDDAFLPRFRRDRYAEGIEAGTEAAIDRIARPHAANPAAPPPDADGTSAMVRVLIPVLMALGFLAVIVRRRLDDITLRLRRCPKCGHRTLRRDREVRQPASREEEGHAVSITFCTHCDYRDSQSYTIPKRAPGSGSGSFGGGSSSGGGASGRW